MEILVERKVNFPQNWIVLHQNCCHEQMEQKNKQRVNGTILDLILISESKFEI